MVWNHSRAGKEKLQSRKHSGRGAWSENTVLGIPT